MHRALRVGKPGVILLSLMPLVCAEAALPTAIAAVVNRILQFT